MTWKSPLASTPVTSLRAADSAGATIDAEDGIGRILAELAQIQPDAAALHVPGRSRLTFADLGAQLRYVCTRLREWDIRQGDIVAGVIPLRPEMAVACATVPAAATLAPLSPAFTTEVYTELLARLRPKALIAPRGLGHPARLAARRCGVAELDLIPDPSAPAGTFELELARFDESLRTSGRTSPGTAYVMCTSGTTGSRKLVPVTHRQVTRYSSSLCDWYGLSSSDIGCHVQPMHLGGGLNSGLMIPWLRGMALVCLPESDIDAFFAALDEHRPTWLNAGFTIHRAILEQAPAHREILAHSSMRLLRAVSGRLEPDEIERIEQWFQAPLLVGLSTCETHAIALEPPPPRRRKKGSVGLPMINDVAVIDQDGTWGATGRLGEIVVRGPLVFEGYFDDARATAAAFVNGWCRTGDLGYFDEDGYLYLKGRVKEIINRGGEKISPAEVDSAIEALAGVRAAATFGAPHPTLGEEIVAAVVKDGGGSINESAIINHVQQRMGPKRGPRRIYFVDQLPRTESGKVRRSELPRLLGLERAGHDAPDAATKAAAPVSALEAALAGLWASTLHVGSVGVNDDFFLLGGDSLRGARLLTSVKAVFSVELPLELLFGHASTVAGMARAIAAARTLDASVDHG